ncbi:Exonuclease III [Sinosporangium album]|uniref:Exonuclease III n=1 Tax=Sinosporangium album TaxID=504805 RepID=A0A1G8ABU8_9ACTN|nr:endonuclease/exonuclease/phosphatase family protein [Sinosporangium album]SDH18316.1 Exonuclease III [Sinosporangium album]
MQITVMSWNIQHGGKDGRWIGQARIINEVNPDFLLLQECSDWPERDARQVAQAEADTGLRIMVGRSRTKGYTAVGWRPEKARWMGCDSNMYALTNGYTGVWFEIPHLPAPLMVVSAHLSCYSAVQANMEIQTILARTHKPQHLGLLGGDLNHVPLGDEEIDWSSVQPYNRSSRCLLPAPEGPPVWRGNPIVAQTLRAADMTDVAAHVADSRGDHSLRAPTAIHGRIRVDQIHVTGALRPAILDYWVIADQDVSDHHPIVARFDLAKIDESKLAKYR